MTPSGILDIITIVYFFPALLIAIYVGLKHGFNKSAGWFNLNLLSVFRLVGSILGLVGIYQPSTGVIVASLTLSSMGTISLLGALLGLSGRANQSLKERSIPPRITRLVNLCTLAAIILAIIGGTKVSSSDPDTVADGRTLSKAAIGILIAVFVIAAVICLQTLVNHRYVPNCEKRLLYVAIASLPFILVRLVLAICSTFDYNSSAFSLLSTTTTAIVIRAIMGLLMEFIVVALFLWAGCTVDRSADREAERAARHGANGNFQGKDGAVYYAKGENGFTHV